jgi:hypothetical protein
VTGSACFVYVWIIELPPVLHQIHCLFTASIHCIYALHLCTALILDCPYYFYHCPILNRMTPNPMSVSSIEREHGSIRGREGV